MRIMRSLITKFEYKWHDDTILHSYFASEISWHLIPLIIHRNFEFSSFLLLRISISSTLPNYYHMNVKLFIIQSQITSKQQQKK